MSAFALGGIFAGIFVIEGVIDELSHLSKTDLVECRRKLLRNHQALGNL